MSFARNMINRYPKLIRAFLKLYAHIPFVNRFRVSKRKDNRFENRGALLKKSRILINGRNNRVVLGPFCRIYNTTISIDGDNNEVYLDNFVFVKDGDFCMEDSCNRISIGEHTCFAGRVHLACIEGTEIAIGKRCLFSANVVFRTGDSHALLNLEGDRINPSKSIQVGDHVWIGNTATVLKGATLPENCIVGTGSIVTKNFEETNCCIAGNPAKIIKRDVNWRNDR